MYIYLNKPIEKIKKMNKDKRSILVANEGVLVSEKNKPGTYLDDNYNVIRFKKREIS
ncbi:hypothetical protein [Geotoga petraea]|jgi:hypothetical protein|uniref:Uncharacterized protein n=1 Tax=Geotoga petraea TaxID=28234 RepID=A0A1G6LRT5_9BACT|nr:hypothetical protein [Geotoga petraea]SDC45787.1 hypothetical protein SAMN04488588_1120 [Geotoga petraea]